MLASWDAAASNAGKIDLYESSFERGGFAICVVGYRIDGRFIVRISWSTSRDDEGFGYVSPSYIGAAVFNEAYGVTP